MSRPRFDQIIGILIFEILNSEIHLLEEFATRLFLNLMLKKKR